MTGILRCVAALFLAQSAWAQSLFLGGHDRTRPNMDATEFLPDSLRNLAVKGLCAGTYHHILIKADGTLTGWGDATDGALKFPPGLGKVKAVSSRSGMSVALREDGSVISWGGFSRQEMVHRTDLTGIKQVAAMEDAAIALREDGTVVQWGSRYLSHTGPDTLHDIVQISAGDDFALALRGNGTIAWWGRDGFEVAAPPSGLAQVKAISAGRAHSLALKQDGTVVAWGSDNYNAIRVPAGLANVKAVAAGFWFSLALLEDGRVVAWGQSSEGMTLVPPELAGVTQISAGYHSWLALAATVPPIALRTPARRSERSDAWRRADFATWPTAGWRQGLRVTDAKGRQSSLPDRALVPWENMPGALGGVPFDTAVITE
jgi:alpha-tubulin suppressor-like RCC1 family protein